MWMQASDGWVADGSRGIDMSAVLVAFLPDDFRSARVFWVSMLWVGALTLSWILSLTSVRFLPAERICTSWNSS